MLEDFILLTNLPVLDCTQVSSNQKLILWSFLAGLLRCKVSQIYISKSPKSTSVITFQGKTVPRVCPTEASHWQYLNLHWQIQSRVLTRDDVLLKKTNMIVLMSCQWESLTVSSFLSQLRSRNLFWWLASNYREIERSWIPQLCMVIRSCMRECLLHIFSLSL